LCIGRFGSVVNVVCSPIIERYFGVPAAVWMGSITCYISFASALVLVFIMKSHKAPGEAHQTSEATPLLDPKEKESDDGSSEEINKHSLMQVIRMLPSTFWLVCLICIMLYGTVIPFNNIASDFLMSKWFGNDTVTAGLYMR
jgi:hypothetical protein